GFSPARNGLGTTNRFSRSNGRTPYYGYPYSYSVWVPDYYDYLNDQSQNAAPYGAPPDAYGPPPALAAPPHQPVIINQYCGAPVPPPANAPETNTTEPQATPGDPIGSPSNYYL